MSKGPGIQRGVLLLLALLFGLSFGLNYGYSNQTTYLLGAVKALHPSSWTRDWLVTQTHFYHPAYAWLSTGLLRLSPSGLLIACTNAVLIAGGMLALFLVLKRLARERAFPAFCLLLVLASVTRTLAPGGTYAFSEIFQPSTLGSLGVLLAAAAFVADRPLASGLCLAFGGAFHVNYLLLGLCVFGVAWLLTGRERLIVRALLGLGPAALVLLFFLPFLLANARPAVSAEALRIYQDVRSPHHYRVPRFAWDFATSAGFQLLGAAVLIGPARSGMRVQRRLLSLLFGCWLLVIPAALLSSVIVVRSITQLLAWRICAEADLLAQTALCAALVSVYCDGRAALRGYDRRAWALAASGLVALLLGSLAGGNWNTSLLVLVLCVVAALISAGWLGRLTSKAQTGLPLTSLSLALVLTFVGVNVVRFSQLARHSNVLSGGDPAVTELCAWAQAYTPENALFLTPPLEEDLRFQCRRAIVVDWKSPPALPSEVLEWFDRIENVSGRHPVLGDADLTGYEQLDAPRVAKLRARYGVDYVVVERGHELDLGVSPLFSGQRFVAYGLGIERASAPCTHSIDTGSPPQHSPLRCAGSPE